MNLVERVITVAEGEPDAVAIQQGDTQVTRGELVADVRRLAALLTGRGLEPGDRVGIMMPNVPEFATAYYAVLAAGGVVVPMNPLLKSGEVAYYLGDSGARLFLPWHDVPGESHQGAEEAGVELIELSSDLAGLLGDQEPADVVAREDSDGAVILFTSGTTGKPKGAELTHHNLRSNAEVFGGEVLQLISDDVVMGCLPMFHTFGQTVSLNCSMFFGARLAMVARFDGEDALRTIQDEGVTLFVGVPTMFSAMLAAREGAAADTSSLRLCLSGGAPLPVEVLTRFDREFDTTIIEGYGLSESSPVASFNPPDGTRKPGSVGLPIPGVEMAILDDENNELDDDANGEIVIRGHNVMRGYWNRPEETAETLDSEGWLHTGDIGHRDSDGYFFIVDRKKALIIRGGYNVYPREIEEVLYEHPAVHEAAVIGVPHETLGEEVGAAVVLSDPSVDVSEVREFVKSKVAAYKYPRQVWVVDELPKTATGKILRREVPIPENSEQ